MDEPIDGFVYIFFTIRLINMALDIAMRRDLVWFEKLRL